MATMAVMMMQKKKNIRTTCIALFNDVEAPGAQQLKRETNVVSIGAVLRDKSRLDRMPAFAAFAGLVGTA
eukprot:1816656-Pyramimonas_sp.AAC.1